MTDPVLMVGAETTAEDVLGSVAFAKACEEITGLPLAATAVEYVLYEELAGKIENLFPMTLQKRPF